MIGDLPPDIAFEVTLQGTNEAVRAALASCMSKFAPLNLSEDMLGQVELVMAETLNNIVEHAFCDRPVPGLIQISCAHRDRLLSLEFQDRGVALPGLALPSPKPFGTATDLRSLPEGGFGWGLIHELTQTIAYQRIGTLNILTLTIQTSEA